MSEKRKILLKNLAKLCKTVADARKILEKSYEETKNIDLDKYKTAEDLEWETLKNIEMLCSRFSRLSDIYIQKLLRLIDEVELIYEGSIIDRLNRAEKRELIVSAEIFIEIRDLRNDISHEYLPEVLMEIFKDSIKYTPELINACKKTVEYAEQLLK